MCGRILATFLVFLSLQVKAKKTAIYHCQQADGQIIIQDRRCVATGSQKVAPPKPQQTRQQNASAQRSASINPVRPQINNTVVRKQRAEKPLFRTGSQSRSRYFEQNWARFLPANWWVEKSLLSGGRETLTLNSKSATKPSQLGGQVSLNVYANTRLNQSIDPFAQALKLYHQIKDNPNHTLIDSQFKGHKQFKVFNIKYRRSSSLLALTEFYIDESNNDLFVITVEASDAHWQSHWQLADLIIQNL